ncbi:MAG: hypothetical protein HPY59_07430 [Anaerolineae bacterium]|nr:hypothetical protein [Anaerolineae bacterium]
MEYVPRSKRGIIDLRGSMVATLDDEGYVIEVHGAEFPMLNDDYPYPQGVLCLDTDGSVVLITTDLDFLTLVGDVLSDGELEQLLKR